MAIVTDRSSKKDKMTGKNASFSYSFTDVTSHQQYAMTSVQQTVDERPINNDVMAHWLEDVIAHWSKM